MKTEFRNRVFLPIVMPLAVLGVIAAVIGTMATIFLWVDREGAVAIAMFAAAGVLVAMSLAATRDRLDARQRSGVALAMATPVVVGALFATGIVGDIPDESRNINAQPHGPTFVFAGLQEGASVLGAESAAGFCLPEQCGTGDTTNEWTLTYDPDGEIRYAFDNQDGAAPHNLFIYAVDDMDLTALDGPLSGAALREYELITPFEPPTFTGPEQQTYVWTPEADAPDLPELAYFVCTIHAGSMWGVVTITAG
jgi:hypothetical protein